MNISCGTLLYICTSSCDHWLPTITNVKRLLVPILNGIIALLHFRLILPLPLLICSTTLSSIYLKDSMTRIGQDRRKQTFHRFHSLNVSQQPLPGLCQAIDNNSQPSEYLGFLPSSDSCVQLPDITDTGKQW